MRVLTAFLLALVPTAAMAAPSAGESAALILRTIGSVFQLIGFLTVATALWRLAMPSAEKEKPVANLLAVLLIGVVMVGGPESAGMGMFHTTAAGVPDTAKPVEVGTGSSIGTSVDPHASTVANDESLWGALNSPIGGARAEGVARISILQVLMTVLGMGALLLLAIALRAQADDDPEEVRPERAVRSRTTGPRGGLELGQGGDGLHALILRIRELLERWYDLAQDALIDLHRRLVLLGRRVGLVARTEGGGAAVSMVVADVRAGGSDVLARLEGYVDRASEKRLSRGGATARAAVNAKWILRSHGIAPATLASASADLAGRIADLLEDRLEDEDVARRLQHVLDRIELGASEIWIERDGDRFYLAPEDDVAAGIGDLRRVDAVRVDWVESAACWTLRPKGRLEIRPRRGGAEEDRAGDDSEIEGTNASTSQPIRSILRDLRGKLIK